MSKKEVLAYVIALLLLVGILYLFRWGQVQLFYGGDLRCVFAECRIQK